MPLIPLVFPYGLALFLSDLAVPSQAGYAADGRIRSTAEQYSITYTYRYLWASLPIYPLTDNIEMISEGFYVLRHRARIRAYSDSPHPQRLRATTLDGAGQKASLSHCTQMGECRTLRCGSELVMDNGILAGRRGRSPSSPRSSGCTISGLSLHVSGL